MTSKGGRLVEVIALLQKWRAQPGYQLERRVDALLAPFLAAFLEKRFGEGASVELVTSELPIPKSLLAKATGGAPEKPRRDHVSADFLLLRHRPDPAWILLELKTDMGSRDDREDANYLAVAGKTMRQVLAALRSAKKGTSFVREYGKQAWAVGAHRYPKARIEICYLQPTRQGPEVVEEGGKVIRTFTLREFADSDVGEGDELWRLLQPLLRGVVRSSKGRRPGRGAKAKAVRSVAR
jgi:hypothetical protein